MTKNNDNKIINGNSNLDEILKGGIPAGDMFKIIAYSNTKLNQVLDKVVHGVCDSCGVNKINHTFTCNGKTEHLCSKCLNDNNDSILLNMQDVTNACSPEEKEYRIVTILGEDAKINKTSLREMYENVEGDNSIWIDCESGLMTYDEILATVEPGLKMFIHNFHLHFSDGFHIITIRKFQEFADKVLATKGCSLHMSWKSENDRPVYNRECVTVSDKVMLLTAIKLKPLNRLVVDISVRTLKDIHALPNTDFSLRPYESSTEDIITKDVCDMLAVEITHDSIDDMLLDEALRPTSSYPSMIMQARSLAKRMTPELKKKLERINDKHRQMMMERNIKVITVSHKHLNVKCVSCGETGLTIVLGDESETLTCPHCKTEQ